MFSLYKLPSCHAGGFAIFTLKEKDNNNENANYSSAHKTNKRLAFWKVKTYWMISGHHCSPPLIPLKCSRLRFMPSQLHV